MYTWQPVAADDFEALHQLRLAAMQPSLEALGIYDSERSRQRFAGRFTPEAARWILCAGERVGFAAMRLGGGAVCWNICMWRLSIRAVVQVAGRCGICSPRLQPLVCR